MAVQLGSGEYTFEVDDNWARVPAEITLGDCAAVGVDRQDRVYAFNRGEHPVAVFDAEGNLLRTWGERVFRRPHGVHMGPDDTIYLTDDGDHTVRMPASPPGSSPRRTAWPSTGTATSMSASFPAAAGRGSRKIRRRGGCG